MTQLSVNLNKVALIRNSRGRNFPNLIQVAEDVLRFGAHGITLHPRPDERHAKRSDIAPMVGLVRKMESTLGRPLEMNVEGYPDPDWLKLVFDSKPDQATLVPDPPEALTSNAGWDFAQNRSMLFDLCRDLEERHIRSSLFLEVDRMTSQQWEALIYIRPRRVELYTEAYAQAVANGSSEALLKRYRACADQCENLGIEINAGHDLDLKNLGLLVTSIPLIQEVSIGHALISEALYLGLERTISEYLKILKHSKGQRRAEP